MTTTDGRRRRWLAGLLGAVVTTAITSAAPSVAVAAEPAAAPAVTRTAAVLLAQPRGDPRDSRSTPSGQAAEARAAEQQARAAAQAARRAAQLAQAGQRARATWEARGRPAKLVVVRTATVDLITGGRLTRRMPRTSGVLTLPQLARSLPGTWLSITGDTARLAAAVVLTPDTTLDIGGGVTQLQLVGGARLQEAASLYTGSGRLVLHGVRVTSADAGSGQPLAPAAGRPFVVVSPAGRLEATDSTFSDLGTSATGEDDRPGVQFNAGSSGALVRSSVTCSSGPLQLAGTQGVRLQDVTVSESAGDGLLLADDHGTTLAGVRAVRNRDDGVHVTGTGTDRPITGITTADNGGFGLSVNRVSGTRVTGVHTSGNGSGGLELSQAGGVTVEDLTATDEPIGVFTHINTIDTVLDRVAITGGRRGVAIEKTTRNLTIRSSTVDRVTVAGIAVGGTGITLQDVTVRDSHTNVRVERGTDGLTAVGLHVTGGQDGVVVSPGTTRVVLRDLTAYGIENDAVRSFSPDARIVGGTITGATTGLNLAAPTTISGTAITLVDNGIRTRSPGLVQADDVQVNAIAVGIDAGADSPFLISASTVHALESVRGELTQKGANDLSLPPLNLLGAIGIPLVGLALVLQHVHLARQRRTGERLRGWTPSPVLPSAESSEPAGRPGEATGRGRLGDKHHAGVT